MSEQSGGKVELDIRVILSSFGLDGSKFIQEIQAAANVAQECKELGVSPGEGGPGMPV